MEVSALKTELRRLADLTDAYLLGERTPAGIGPPHLREAVMAYPRGGGKRLRPALVLLACRALGGDELAAVPAAAAVEVFHTWTLVHDDIIDRDDTRRGMPTVHARAADAATRRFGLVGAEALHYGEALGILTGDVLHGLAVRMFLDTVSRGADATLVVELLRRMEGELLNGLIEGELLDVEFSLMPAEELDEEKVLRMMRLKTGLLLQFSATAGAAIGAGVLPEADPRIEAVGAFAAACGVAFQLQDDILGIVGDEAKLGKPVGSDIREGKRTMIALHALNAATGPDRRFLSQILGSATATDADVRRAAEIFRDTGSIEYAAAVAAGFIEAGKRNLAGIPASPATDTLEAWADSLPRRTF